MSLEHRVLSTCALSQSILSVWSYSKPRANLTCPRSRLGPLSAPVGENEQEIFGKQRREPKRAASSGKLWRGRPSFVATSIHRQIPPDGSASTVFDTWKPTGEALDGWSKKKKKKRSVVIVVVGSVPRLVRQVETIVGKKMESKCTPGILVMPSPVPSLTHPRF